MELIVNLKDLFFQSIFNIVTNAPYIVYLVCAAFGSALIFNLIHEMLGGARKKGK